jgi:hypothetical protein
VDPKILAETVLQGCTKLQLADMNNDGALDVVLVASDSNLVWIFKNKSHNCNKATRIAHSYNCEPRMNLLVCLMLPSLNLSLWMPWQSHPTSLPLATSINTVVWI